MKFKKIAALCMAAAMALSMVACGSSSSTASTESSTAESTVESTTDTTDSSTETVDTPDVTDAAGVTSLNVAIIPKCVHEWFELVNQGAQIEASAIKESLGIDVTVNYMAPSSADITEQNAVLEQAASTQPDFIAIDPVDYEGSKQVIEEIQEQGITVILFDAAVEGSGLTSIGNSFAEQGELEAKDLAERLGGKGKVAVMHGVTTSPNHCERYDAMQAVLAEYPDIEVIDGGASQDNIETAQQQAAAVIAANPDLDGYLCVDGAAPIGISAAINEADKKGEITFVGAENLLQILEYIKDGTICCSYSVQPQMQGEYCVLLALQDKMGIELPSYIDTGITYIDQSNVDEMIQALEDYNAQAAQ